MELTVIAILLILLLMIITMYFILKSLIISINEKGNEFFTLKLSELDRESKKNKNEKDNIEEKSSINVVSQKNEKNIGNESIVMVKSHNVEEFDVKDVMNYIKKIDSKFNYDDKYIVEEFVKKVSSDNTLKKYNDLKKIKKYINRIGRYNLLLDQNDEIIKLKEYITTVDNDLLNNYLKTNDIFEIEGFISFLDIEIEKLDPTIYVYVGNENISFNNISNRIKTVYSKDVYKGVKIMYKGVMYDYSIG